MAEHPPFFGIERASRLTALSDDEHRSVQARRNGRTSASVVGTLLTACALLWATASSQQALGVGGQALGTNPIDPCAFGVDAPGCYDLQQALHVGVADFETLARLLFGVPDSIVEDVGAADIHRVLQARLDALADPTTRFSLASGLGGEYMCIHGRALAGFDAMFDAHDGCTAPDGTGRTAIGVPVSWSRPATPAPESGATTTNAAPSEPDSAGAFWTRPSQALVDERARALTAAQTERWRIDNEGHSTFLDLAEQRVRFALRLTDFWSSDEVIDHNRAALEQQRHSARLLYWITITLVIAGIVLTVVQFIIAAVTSLRVKPDLDAVVAAAVRVPHDPVSAPAAEPTATPPAVPGSPTNATPAAQAAPVLTAHDHVRLAETEFKFEMQKIGFSVRTSIVGVVLLFASFAFMFLYMRYAFPLSFPQVPALESTDAPSDD